MKKNILVPTIALFVICLVATTLLAFANSVTAPIIDELAVKTEMESRKKVCILAEEFVDKKENGISYAVGVDKDGKELGMVFTTTAKSYGGEILVMTGVDMDGKVSGVELLSINDTAGLGMNATKDDFRMQFHGLVNGIKVMKNSSNPDNNEITALTGATITSQAVTDAVNAALADFEAVTGKAGAN
ncbi:MAG: FMN-binding protein [Clostridia bacterium]|nr:FMN-binding protein [Clostridia bacterium]